MAPRTETTTTTGTTQSSFELVPVSACALEDTDGNGVMTGGAAGGAMAE